MPLDQRRAALMAATEPLLEEFGRDVSTRQIAEAARVAEGTIFRAFPTKEALIDAVIDDVFDVQRTCDELAGIELDRDLEARLVAAVEVLQDRQRRVFALFHSMRLRPRHDQPDVQEKGRRDNDRLDTALARVLEPDYHRLRLPVRRAARAVRVVPFALTPPMLGDGGGSEPRQVVDLVRHGIEVAA